MIRFRLQTKVSPEELEEKKGRILTPGDFNTLLTGPSFVSKPDGQPLCVYLPGILPVDVAAAAYPTLHSLRSTRTDNRGLASGMPRRKEYAGAKRSRTKAVPSAIIGSYEGTANRTSGKFCRLTAWTGQHAEQFATVVPLLQVVARLLKDYVPQRYQAQQTEADRTASDWIIAGTPFSTVTVNNSYPTGVHTDKGDLDAGFSAISVLRRGGYTGGQLVFPEYRVAVDFGDRDVLLMDAHEWHGNCFLHMQDEAAERISIVTYFRSKMVQCGTAEEERQKALGLAEKFNGMSQVQPAP